MKKMIWLFSAALLLVLGAVIGGCASQSPSDTTTTSIAATTTTTSTSTTTTTVYTYPTAVLTHWGFDFATGVATNEPGIDDGNIVNWAPDPSVGAPGYTQWAEFVWWCSSLNYILWDGNDYAQNMGSPELSSVTAVPSTWASGEVLPLLAGQVWVIKCTPEGYAKIKIISAGTQEMTSLGPFWGANVQYYFTSEAVFDK